jgi:hypothetical protein
MQTDDLHAAAAPRPIDLMIVGAPKSGTTSLKSYLAQHPGIFAHPQREFIYFAHDDEFAQGYERAWQLYLGGAAGGQAVAAKSVAMMYSPLAMRRLREHSPGARVVLVLRNPVERAYSEFAYARRRGRETAENFEVAVRRALVNDLDVLQPGAYVARGRYVEFVEPILAQFPGGQVSVIAFDSLAADPVSVCRQLYGSLALDVDFAPSAERRENPAAGVWSQALLKVTADRSRFGSLRRRLRPLISQRNRQRIRSALQRINDRPLELAPMTEETKRQLLEYYAPWNRRLAHVLGADFAPWSRLA